MQVHLVKAHPEPDSFNSAMHQQAKITLSQANVNYFESDLYSMRFNPVAGYDDVKSFPKDEYFHLIKAQRWALDNQTFSNEMLAEQEKLQTSDLLILQFPLWWWSFPAILKGWIDRVLSSGFAYGNGAVLKPKKVMYSLTTGGASNAEEHAYYQNKINALYEEVFGYMGWKILPPFIAHGVQSISQPERQQLLADYAKHLQKVLNQ